MPLDPQKIAEYEANTACKSCTEGAIINTKYRRGILTFWCRLCGSEEEMFHTKFLMEEKGGER